PDRESMNLDQLARYLQRDARELRKLATRGHLPGQQVGGEWRFARGEILIWLETQLPTYTDEQLTAVERGAAVATADEASIAELFREATIALPLAARTRSSVLRA